MPEIVKSVGYGGQNNKADVLVVQRLLNNFTTGMGLAALVVDGGFGDITGRAIKRFQAQIMGLAKPDGRVDPGGRTIHALGAVAAPGPGANPAQRSGAAWWHANQARYTNSDKLTDLIPEFAGKVQAFIDAMRAGGAQVKVSSTRRNPIRAYLMHYSWRLAAGQVSAASIPAKSGCEILWDHGSEAASRSCAREMRDLFNIAYQPSLTSRHIEGKAIDMTITWTGDLVMRDGQGRLVTIAPPRSGDVNAMLHRVGASYGVIKLVSDKPHWSTDGH
jgi:hypothetical protein